MLLDLEKLRRAVEERLSPKRYAHSLAVEKQAAALARLHGADWFKAAAAGLLHDICHDLDEASQLNYLRSCGILLDVLTLENPPIWHAISGARYVQDVLGVTDREIVDAIRYHTTGRRDMSPLEKVVYVADLTSDDRTYPGVETYREAAGQSLDKVMRLSLRHTLQGLTDAGKPIVQDAYEAYNYYLPVAPSESPGEGMK